MNSFYLYLGFDRPIHPETNFAIIQLLLLFFFSNKNCALEGSGQGCFAIILSVFRIFHSFFRGDLQYFINCNFLFTVFSFLKTFSLLSVYQQIIFAGNLCHKSVCFVAL